MTGEHFGGEEMGEHFGVGEGGDPSQRKGRTGRELGPRGG